MKRRRPWVVLSAATVMAAAFPQPSSSAFVLEGQSSSPGAPPPTISPAATSKPYCWQHQSRSVRGSSSNSNNNRYGVRLRQAMSSSDLKKSVKHGHNDPPDQDSQPTRQPRRKKRGRPRKNAKHAEQQQQPSSSTSPTSPQETTTTFPKDSVVHRLKQASLRAAAAEERRLRQEQQQQQQQQSSSSFTHYNYNTTTADEQQRQRPLASLRDLTAAIDRQLQQARQGGASLLGGGGGVGTAGAAQQQQLWSTRDSLAAVLAHNERQEQQKQQQQQQQQSAPSVLPTSLLVSSRGRRGGPASAAAAAAAMTVVEKHVAIVLSKPLQNDQISIEYASRVQRLVRTMKYGDDDDDSNKNKPYQPDVVVFVGGRHPHAHLADCDAGYAYFRHLCAAQHVAVSSGSGSSSSSTSNIQFRLERSNVQEGALRRVAQHLQRHHLPQWVDQVKKEQQQSQQQQQQKSQSSNNNNSTGTTTTTTKAASPSSRSRRVKLLVRFALFSSEYHLCILNDIHVRSPVNSPLAAFERWSLEDMESSKTSTKSTTSSNGTISSSTPYYHQHGISNWLQLETSWTYQYATTPRIPTAHDPVRALAAACYRRAQSLIPVLVNLRGVAQNHEFFQRDNYRVLVQARRSLVRDMEELYQRQPSLAAVHQQTTPLFRRDCDDDDAPPTDAASHGGTINSKPLDVVLEGALLSLGRCLDLVRPAGLLTGSVPAQDFVMAIALLEQTVSQISAACDPDRPLPAAEWGVLPTATTTTTTTRATTNDDDGDNDNNVNAGSSTESDIDSEEHDEDEMIVVVDD